MDKYYTPELKDLYAGYQCERLGKTENGLEYFPFLIGGTSINLNHIRTKYLTQEDIESLGWKWQRTYDRNGTYRGAYPTKMEFELGDVWKMGGGFLEFKPETTEIKITTVDEGFNADGPNHSIKYQGKAKSINELKKIMEWML